MTSRDGELIESCSSHGQGQDLFYTDKIDGYTQYLVAIGGEWASPVNLVECLLSNFPANFFPIAAR